MQGTSFFLSSRLGRICKVLCFALLFACGRAELKADASSEKAAPTLSQASAPVSDEGFDPKFVSHHSGIPKVQAIQEKAEEFQALTGIEIETRTFFLVDEKKSNDEKKSLESAVQNAEIKRKSKGLRLAVEPTSRPPEPLPGKKNLSAFEILELTDGQKVALIIPAIDQLLNLARNPNSSFAQTQGLQSRPKKIYFSMDGRTTDDHGRMVLKVNSNEEELNNFFRNSTAPGSTSLPPNSPDMAKP